MKRLRIHVIFLLLVALLIGCSAGDRSKREVRGYMKQIHEAAEKYRRDYGDWPVALEELLTSDLLFQNKKLEREWQFIFYWPDEILAISTEEMPGGEGIRVRYEIKR